jgi:DNA-binding HxlR family transcriptional regulator
MACTWESIKVDANTVSEKLKALIHEGNVRRVVVKHEGRTVAEFPLTAGVVGAVIAPILAAVAAIAAMLKDCTVEIERVDQNQKHEAAKAAAR